MSDYNIDNNLDELKEKVLTDECSKADRCNYFNQLEAWLQEVYSWQSIIAMFPHCLVSSQVLNNTGISVTTIFPQSSQQNNELRERRQNVQTEPLHPLNVEGFEYRIPPVWKRFVAESIDSIMLFLLKLAITFIAVDVFDFINIEPSDIDLLQRNLKIDYKMAVELTSSILILELVHRIIVCIFEAFWLQRGLYGHIGGATPGKSVMGLRVVQCRSVIPVERPDGDEIVLVSPGTDLGLPLALGRSVVKNLILAFLFPICFSLCFFRFNRTGYDLICNSIVVEDPYRSTNNNNNNNIRRGRQ